LVTYKLYDIGLKFFCVDLLVSGVKRRIDMHLTIHSARKGGFLHQISMFFPACSPILSRSMSVWRENPKGNGNGNFYLAGEIIMGTNANQLKRKFVLASGREKRKKGREPADGKRKM